MKRSHLAREIVEIIALTVLIFVVIHFTIQSYHVDGPSMKPNLAPNEYVVVNKTAYLLHPPERGDVIVFHFPYYNKNETPPDYIKRVIGLPGDTIRYDASHVWVNGVQLQEPYISKPANPNMSTPEFKVPPDNYFVMGDNREVSDDSRYWGPVDKKYIVGKAVLVSWPATNWQVINTYPTVFAAIKPNH